MNDGDCPAELVLAERRGKLSSSQRIALGKHLRVCESCRILRNHGHAFDQAESLQQDDRRRLDSLLSASERWLEEPRLVSGTRSSKRVGRVVLLAALLIGTGAAAATAGLVVRSFGQKSVPAAPIVAQDRTLAAAPAVTPDTPHRTLESSAEVPQLEPESTNDRARAHEPVARPSLTASQLLQQANSARRSGDAAGATRLFRQLQQAYPNSREARLSFVAFGSLLLEQGQAAAALTQFNRYLASSSGQNLTAEALYGKGRALSRLGQSSEERAAWTQLIERFPNSPYVSYARKRLGPGE